MRATGAWLRPEFKDAGHGRAWCIKHVAKGSLVLSDLAILAAGFPAIALSPEPPRTAMSPSSSSRSVSATVWPSPRPRP
ncbi:hypothetical protein [Streptomyces sp. NPDC000880]